MCVAFPGKIVEIDENNFATVDIMGVKKKVSLMILPDKVKIGDFVISHAGFAINKVEKDEAEESLEILKELINEVSEND